MQIPNTFDHQDKNILTLCQMADWLSFLVHFMNRIRKIVFKFAAIYYVLHLERTLNAPNSITAILIGFLIDEIKTIKSS